MFRNIIKIPSKQITRFTNVSKTFSKRTFLLDQNKFRIQCPIPTKSLQSSFIHSTRNSFKNKSITLSNSHSDSSHSHTNTQTSSSDTSSATSQHYTNARLLIAFTCKVCSLRSTKTMSRHAYDHGVVIIQCS